MTRTLTLLLPLALLGCPAPIDTGETTDSHVSSQSSDSQVPTETDVPTLTINLTEGEGLRVGLFSFRFPDGDDDIPEILSEDGSALFDADGTASLELHAPSQDRWEPLFEGVSGVVWAFTAYDDLNEDGVRDSDEPTVAASRQFLLFVGEGFDLDGEPVPAESFLLLEIGDDDDEPTILPLEQSVDMIMVPYHSEVTVSGTIDETMLAGVTGMTTRTLNDGATHEYDLAPFDLPLGTTDWSFTIHTPLDEGRQFTIDAGFDMPITIERPMVYEDLTSTGGFGDGDPIRGWGCYDEKPLVLLYVPEVLDPIQTVMMDRLGMTRGWSINVLEEDRPPIHIGTELTDAVFLTSGACVEDVPEP